MYEISSVAKKRVCKYALVRAVLTFRLHLKGIADCPGYHPSKSALLIPAFLFNFPGRFLGTSLNTTFR